MILFRLCLSLYIKVILLCQKKRHKNRNKTIFIFSLIFLKCSEDCFLYNRCILCRWIIILIIDLFWVPIEFLLFLDTVIGKKSDHVTLCKRWKYLNLKNLSKLQFKSWVFICSTLRLRQTNKGENFIILYYVLTRLKAWNRQNQWLVAASNNFWEVLFIVLIILLYLRKNTIWYQAQ